LSAVVLAKWRVGGGGGEKCDAVGDDLARAR
jgi:hypothetical protein